MGKVRIVTDSTSDIPASERERLGISMIPLKVLFGEETILDAITLTSEQFYNKLIAAPELPRTSQPSPAEFVEVYEKLLDEDPDSPIISIHLSAALSGTYQSAFIAESMIERDADITVIDSQSASAGFGISVLKAAEMAQAGESKEAIVAELKRLKQDISIYFLVDTLEYLQKGGRIGKASALMGSLLNIKPILSLDQDGVVYPVDKVRGMKKAMQRICDMLQQTHGAGPVEVTIAYSHTDGYAKELSELVQAQFDVKKLSFITIGAVIGTYVGPGTSAVFMHNV